MGHLASSIVEPLCGWDEGSRKFAVHLPSEVIGRLATESWTAFKAVPRRGLEIGGILLGHIDCEGDTTTFCIEGFQAVESEHRLGPSYVLSAADYAHLDEALTRNRTTNIGIYRSQTRSEQLEPQEQDIQLFERCFDTTDALFLMLGPVPGTAAFFIHADGKLKCVHEFALASLLSSITMLGQGSTMPRQGSAGPRPELHPRPHRKVRMMPPSHPARSDGLLGREDALVISGHPSDVSGHPSDVSGHPSEVSGHPSEVSDHPSEVEALTRSLPQVNSNGGVKRYPWRIAALLSAFLIFTLGLTILLHYIRRGPVPEARPIANLHLRVERAGSSIRLIWDRNALALGGASHGVVYIQDGDHHSDRDLTSSELRAGSIIYAPATSDLTFRLDVYPVGPSATGSLQVISLPPPSSNTRTPSSNTRTPSGITQPPSGGNGNLSGRSSPTPAPTRTSNPVLPLETSLMRGTEALAADRDPIGKQDNPSPVSRTSKGVETNASASTIADAPAPLAVEKPQRSSTLEHSAVPVSQPILVQILPEPVSGSRLGHLVSRIPVVRRLRKPDNTAAPVPRYQALPTLNRGANQVLSGPVSVDVKVSVGETGTVTHAEVVHYGDPPNWTLANAALSAAQRWTFEPARVDDAVVPSEVVLHFQFRP